MYNNNNKMDLNENLNKKDQQLTDDSSGETVRSKQKNKICAQQSQSNLLKRQHNFTVGDMASPSLSASCNSNSVKTSKKLNKKFNRLQKKISSLIASNLMETTNTATKSSMPVISFSKSDATTIKSQIVADEDDENEDNDDDEDEISEIESFVFNADEEYDDQISNSNNLNEHLKKNNYFSRINKFNNNNNDSNLNVEIDQDTRVKLKALLENAGIDSITSDLLKDPHIMQTLTHTYVKTLNEVVSKTQLKSENILNSNNINNSNSNINDNKNNSLDDVVESTFEEFILAAAAVAAASSGSSVKKQINEENNDNYYEDDDDINELKRNLLIGDDLIEAELKERLDDISNMEQNLENFKDDDEEEEDDEDDEDILDEDDDEEDEDEEDEDEDDDEDYSEDDEFPEQSDTNKKDLKNMSNQILQYQEKEKMLSSLAIKSLKKNAKRSKEDYSFQNSGLLLFSTKNSSSNFDIKHQQEQLNMQENSINECLNNLNNPESILSKLIEFQSNNDLTYNDSTLLTTTIAAAAAAAAAAVSNNQQQQQQAIKTNLDPTTAAAAEAVAAVAAKKLVVGKSLTELLEENADSVLGLACASGYIELVTVLLAINANVEDKGHKNESTPLMEACMNGHKQIVELLLKHGANINAQSASGNTPLHCAVQNNHSEIVDLLIKYSSLSLDTDNNKKLRLEETNENGHTPLMEAASAGHVECARLLIEAGAGINTYSNEFKETALTLACYKGHVDMIKFLLEQGADQEHKTDEMHTALMEACMDGHVEAVKILIEHNSQVNMPPDSFESPLTLAACGGHVELANLLIDHKANLEERNDEGYTPLMEAAREGHEEMVALLLFHGADINAITSETQETALTLACCGGCYEVAKFLLEAGADVNLGSASTPLMEAAQEGHLELVQLLLKAGAQVNKFSNTITTTTTSTNSNNNTTNNNNITSNSTSCESALTLACENGHLDVVDTLVKAGAQIDFPDPEKGFTPLMKSARTGQFCIVQYLLKNFLNQTDKSTTTTVASNQSIDINRTTPNNEHNALSLACQNGHYQVVELLLKRGANPLQCLKDNSNCLIEAAKGGHTKIVELLIDWNNIHTHHSLKNEHKNNNCCNHNQRKNHSCKNVVDSVEKTIQVSKTMNENLKDTKLKKKSSGVITKKKSTQADTKLLISNKKNDQVTSSSLITNESPIIKQIKKSVSRLDTTSDIGLENLVNVLHHFAFGDNNQKQSLNAKKSMIKQETESVDDDDDDDDDDFENCGVVVEELCSCERREINLNKYCQQHDHQDPSIKTNRNNNGSSSLLHLSLSIGKKSEADDLKFKQNLLSSKLEERYLDYFEEVHNEDEQIKRKENLLQELLKIEKQLDSQKNLNNLNEIASSISPSITIKNSSSAQPSQPSQPSQPVDTKTNNSNNNNNNNSNNYDHISMINKYLIKKCQYDLNRLYKIKLKQLQQKPIEIKPPTNFQIGGSNTAITATTTTTTTTQSSMKNIKTAKKRLISSSSSSSSTSSPSVIKQQQQKETSNNSSTVISASISNSLIEFKKLSNNPDILNKGPVESSITTLNDLQTNYFKSTNKDKSEQQHTCSHGTHHHHYHHHNHHHNHQVANKSNNNNNNVLQITNNKNKIKSNTKQRLDQQQQPSSPLSSSSSTCSDDWLPPPPPPFAAAAAYLIQQSMKNKASQNNYPHIDLDAATESNHDTALTVACAGGHEELVKLLIEKGAHIEHRDKKGFTPLILAATLGYQRIVQLLLIYGADVEAQSERNKDTALSAACQAGKYECCEILLTKGQANKEHRNISDYTPLSLAASGGYVNIIKLLLSHGAEINSRTGSKLGISPLMLAAMNGHTQAVKLLIDMGSDVNAQIETNRNTALTLACFQGRHDVVSLLLERKANIEHRAKTGLTPLMEAASGGYEIVGRILLEKGADVNASPVPNSKDTALTIAAEKGHLKFVQLLIEYGSQLDVKNKKGATPLWLACQNGHLEVAQTLVLNSSDPDSTDSRKVSCLMSAFRKGHVKVCKFMVRHVRQFPSDQDCKRLIDSLNETSSASNSFNNTKITAVLSNKNQPTQISLSNLGSIQQNNQQNSNNNMIDKDLIKRCMQCMELIFQAKDKQAQEANRVANNLLKEIECEKTKEQNKKAAAQRKREKRKQKKKQQTKEEKQQDADDLKEAKKGAETKKSDNKKLEANKKIKEIDDDVSDNNSEPNQSSSESDQEEEPQIKKEDPKFSNKATNIKLNSVPIKSNEIKEKLAKDKTNIPSKNLQQQSKILPLANSNKQQQLTLNKKMSQTNLSSLADLDDFDQPSPSSTLTVIKKANNKTANNSKTQNNISTQAQNNSNYNSNKQKQRIIVPFDKFLRVMGHANSNLKIIQEVTGTSLEVEDKKIPPNQDRSILIRGESVDMVKYAFELLQALINDADVELLNLLPSKPEPTTSNKSTLNSQQQQNKWANPLVTSNTSKSTNNYNPLLGGITLLNDKTVDLSKKPRNFAEVVAKQSISTTTLNSDTVATNRISNIEKKNNSDANKQTQQQLNTNTRKHNSVSPFQKPAAIAATSQTYASKNNQVNSNVSSTQNLNKLNNLVVPLNENKNNNKVPIVALVSDNLDKNLSSKSKANEINTKPISIVSPYASNNLTEVNAKSQQQLIQSINNNSKIVSESINKVETQIENKNNQPLVLTPQQQQQQNSLFLLQTQNSIVSHPGAPPSAPPSLPNSSFSSLSSSSSSTSSSSSSNTLLPDTSMILNDFLKQNPNNNLNMNNVNNANCSFENNAASMETLRKLTQLIPSLGVQNQSDAVAVLNKLTHLINDENEYNKVKNNGLNLNIILNESANQHINQLNTPSSSSSSSLNNKPIGYERHEKQIQHANNNNNIINNIPVNQNRNSLIQDMNFPFFPNNFVNNSNFLEQQQNMKNFLSPSNLPLINQTQNLETLNNLDLLAFETQKAKLLSQFDANNMAALNVPFNNLNINETFQINNNNNNNINNIISNEIAFQQMPLFNQWINSDFNSNNRVNFPPINNLLLANNQINLATAKMGISSSNQNSNILPPGVFSYSDIGLNNQFQNDEHIHFQNLDTHKNNNWVSNQLSDPYLFGQFLQQQQQQNQNQNF